MHPHLLEASDLHNPRIEAVLCEDGGDNREIAGVARIAPRKAWYADFVWDNTDSGYNLGLQQETNAVLVQQGELDVEKVDTSDKTSDPDL